MMTKRTVVLTEIVVVVVAGIASRLVVTGVSLFDNYVGDALYAMLAYVLLTLVWIKGKPLTKAGITIVVTILIETFELTGIGAQLWQSHNLALKLLGIVLGTTFGWWDIVAYIVGTAVISLIDWQFITRMNHLTR